MRRVRLVILQKESWFKPSTHRAFFSKMPFINRSEFKHFCDPCFVGGRRVTKCLVVFRDPAQWKSGGWLEDQEQLETLEGLKYLSFV